MTSKKDDENPAATAPLFSESENQAQNTSTMAAPPPPPYYEPLPQLHPNPPSNIIQQPSAFYLGPITIPISVGSSPTRLRCPNCQADVITQINHKSGCMTWALCGSICAIGLFAPCAWFGCQLIPFCIDSCKDVQHNCSNCKAYIATFDRMR